MELSSQIERGRLGGEQVRRKIPVLGVHWSSDIVSIEDIVLYLVLAPQPRLTKNWTFPAHLLPAEMVTASLSPTLKIEREKVIKPSHRFEIR